MADQGRTGAELDESPVGNRRWYMLAALTATVAMVMLDGTLVAVSIPAIVGDLHLDFTQAQWIFCVYSVVLVVALIAAGRIGDRIGRRTILTLGAVVFIAGALLAASADTAGPLIWGRIVQGIGAAAALAGALATVTAIFRGQDRRFAYVFGIPAIAAAGVLGALLAGWFTSSFTWPWIFLLEALIGLVVLIGIVLAVPETRIRGARAHLALDVDGWLLGTAGFALVIFALVEGQRYGWGRPRREFTLLGLTWSPQSASSVIPLVLIVGVLLLLLFVLWERHRAKVEHPALLDFSQLRDPRRWGDLTAFFVVTALFGILFALPLYLVNCLGLSTLRSGLVLVALAGGALLASIATSWPARTRALPSIWLVRAGLVIELVAAAVAALVLGSTVSAWVPTVLLACYGVGLGLAAAPLTGRTIHRSAAMASEPGSLTAATARHAGAVLGVAVLGGVLSIGLGHFLHSRLDSVAGLESSTAAAVAAATRDSAGDAISGLRVHQAPDAVTDALAAGLADATRITLLGTAVVLLLALLAASRLPLPVEQIPGPGAGADTGAEGSDAADAATGKAGKAGDAGDSAADADAEKVADTGKPASTDKSARTEETPDAG